MSLVRSARRIWWLVQFRYGRCYFFVGYFKDEVNAAKPYDEAIAPLAGEFARRNSAAYISVEHGQ